MKIRLFALIGSLGLLLGCQPGVEYAPRNQSTAVENQGQQNTDKSQDSSPSEVAAKVEEDSASNETPASEEVSADASDEAPVEASPLSNADLLAMDEVVITAVLNNGATYYSDVGNTAVTNAAAIADAAKAPTGTQLSTSAPLMVKAGQRMTFCNHASSNSTLRVHASNRSAFAHWGSNQVLAPGECSTGRQFPEVINTQAVGNNPGNNLYNHNQNANNSPIHVQIIQ